MAYGFGSLISKSNNIVPMRVRRVPSKSHASKPKQVHFCDFTNVASKFQKRKMA